MISVPPFVLGELDGSNLNLSLFRGESKRMRSNTGGHQSTGIHTGLGERQGEKEGESCQIKEINRQPETDKYAGDTLTRGRQVVQASMRGESGESEPADLMLTTD